MYNGDEDDILFSFTNQRQMAETSSAKCSSQNSNVQTLLFALTVPSASTPPCKNQGPSHFHAIGSV